MKLTLSVIFIIVFKFSIYSQSASYFQSGYTGLLVQLSGTDVNQLPLDYAGIRSAVNQGRQVGFSIVNDSTYLLSFYTFGPTHVYFKVKDQVLSTILLPRQQDSLHIAFEDSTILSTHYKGSFKYFFDESDVFSNALIAAISHSNEYAATHFRKKKKLDGVFSEAELFRDSRLERIKYLKERFNPLSRSSAIKRIFENSVQFAHLGPLVRNYESAIVLHNKNIGLDSTDALRYVPPRDDRYYSKIINETLADTITLDTYFYSMFFNDISQDPFLDLPKISEVPPSDYIEILDDHFGEHFESSDNLFYSMIIATAYINQINDGQILSTKQIMELQNYWQNNPLSDIILFENNLMKKTISSVSEINYLNFPSNEVEVLTDILAAYKGKVVVLDFWATWCGPCLEAFNNLKAVKKKYLENNQVVFVYITNESSNFNKWNEFVNILGGEHYYLFNEQFDSIQNKYGFRVIPTYLIFDKKGNLSNSKIGFTGSANEIDLVIEDALK